MLISQVHIPTLEFSLMATSTKRVKPNSPTKKDIIPNSEAVDRISELPDALIHHILSFLTTIDVVRMSILSRHWKYMWYSIPAVHFSDTDHRGCVLSYSQRNVFYNFVNECLKRRERTMRYLSNSVITRFKLDLHEHYSLDLDKWLTFATRQNIKELDLRTEGYYCLPKRVLNVRSLTVLKLNSLHLNGSGSISLPSLTSLSLVDVTLRDKLLRRLLLGCPSLEKFLFKECDGLSNPLISSSTLKVLDIVQPHTYSRAIKVEAINLHSFLQYDGFCKVIDLSACKEIRNLSLLGNSLDDQSLQDLISGLPLLESLTLEKCVELKRIRICGQFLKSIRLEQSCYLVEVTIEAPNLDSFWYKGDTKCDISINKHDNILNGHFMIEDYSLDENYDTNWNMNLIRFLSHINLSWNTLSLHVQSEEVCITKHAPLISFVD